MKCWGAVLLPLLGGCWFLEVAAPLTGSTSDWYETGSVRKPRREIYDLVVSTAKRQGFRVSARDPEFLWMETDWDVHLSTHWREGFRTKLEVELVPEDRGSVNVRVRSRREINDNAKNPVIEGQAMWIPAGMSEKQKARIPEPAMRLHQSLKLTFFGFNNG